MSHIPYLTERDEVKGFGPGQAFGLTTDVLHQAYRFIMGEFVNGVTGSVVIETPQALTDDAGEENAWSVAC